MSEYNVDSKKEFGIRVIDPLVNPSGDPIGLVEQIRDMEKQMVNACGIPFDVINLRPQRASIDFIGSEEFINKFKKVIDDIK